MVTWEADVSGPSERTPSTGSAERQGHPSGEGQTLVERFNETAARNPEREAVTCGTETCSYQSLQDRATRLAWHLADRGVERGSLVALYLPRTLDMIVAILGTLKAGAAYVPLDRAYPRQRLSFILSDAEPGVLVTTEGLRHEVPPFDGEVVDLRADQPAIDAKPTGGQPLSVNPEDLAYVLYTSGSTGQPKGALISHRNVVRLFDQTQGWFEFDEDDVWTLFHSYAFDFSVWELWGGLLYGGRVVIVSDEVSRAPDRFRELLSGERVTVLNQTPSAFRQLMAADARSSSPLCLRYVIFGGEELQPSTLRPWAERHGLETPQLINMYGITETTVHVTYRPLSVEDIESGSGSPIGRAIPDLKLYLLDETQTPVPDGETGELYVAGPGLARGYLRRDELTRERFIPSPFPDTPGGRLYRTGDLARRRSDGELEYLGRDDDQVKIRGFRVEVGEVESTLRTVPGVQDAVVTARADGEGQGHLVAYVVPHDGPPPARGELRAALQTQLPSYMVPGAFVFISEVPLTPNGKLDRRALPEPGAGRREVLTPYVGPQTETQMIVARIWRDVLRLDKVGIHDNFFELGGDSMSIVDVATRLRSRFPELDVVTLFEQPTLEGLASRLEALATPDQGLSDIDRRASRRRAARPGPRGTEERK